MRFSSSRCNCGTGLWMWKGKWKTFQAKVVDLFLVSSFSEKEAGKLLESRSCSLMLTLKIWHKMARSDATGAHFDPQDFKAGMGEGCKFISISLIFC